MDLCDVSEVGSRSNSLEEQRISLSWQGERAGVFGEGRRVEDVYNSLAAMHHPSCIAAGAFGFYSAASVAIAAYSIVNSVRPEELAHTTSSPAALGSTTDESSSVHPTGVEEELDDASSEYTTDSEDREDAVAGNHIVDKVVASFPDILAGLLVGIIALYCASSGEPNPR